MKAKTTKTFPSFTVTILEVNGIKLSVLTYTGENNSPLFTGKEPVIYYVLEGKYTITAGKKPYTIKAGEALVVMDALNLPVEIAQKGLKLFAFQFSEDWCLKLDIPLPVLETAAFSKGMLPYTIVTSLHRRFRHTGTHSTIAIQRMLLHLLEHLLTEQEKAKPKELSWAVKLRPLLPGLTIDELNLTHLGRLGGVSEVTISNGFEEQFGLPLQKYRANRQHQTALTLFAEGRHNYKQIGVICRHNDYAYFSKVFKKEMGVTPCQYWKDMKPL